MCIIAQGEPHVSADDLLLDLIPACAVTSGVALRRCARLRHLRSPLARGYPVLRAVWVMAREDAPAVLLPGIRG
jgi:hypothetical protein